MPRMMRGILSEPVNLPKLGMVVVHSGVRMPTPLVFAALGGGERCPAPPVAAALLASAPATGIAPPMARMSGPGSACFRPFDTEPAATAAVQELATARPDWWAPLS
jgi:4-diphosphocytidyl-2C-methyl-D-erythritol kinase